MSILAERIASLSLPKRALLESNLLSRSAEPSASAISPRARHGDEAPVSFSQERLWFLDQLVAGSTAYNVPALLRLKMPVDAGVLERSLSELIRRHEVLRTTFRAVAGSPMQVIAREAKMSLAVLDLRGWPVWAREEEARRLAAVEAQRPFDLTAGPLFRASLLCLGEADFLLLLTLHHIVVDGWSLGVLLRELETVYGAYLAGLPSPLPELPLQFADYASWQREHLQGEELERHLAYWRDRLAGAPPVLELPFDRPRPAAASQRGAAEALSLPQEVAEGLKSLAQGEGATLFMVLLSAFAALLHRYTGSVDLVVGTPIANRTRSELEGLIGFFANSLALRLDLAGDPTFPELLRRVREVTLGAFGHQDLPFEKLVEELHPQRSLSHNPVFQVMFLLQNTAPEAQAGEGAAERPREAGGAETGTAKFDLLLAWAETPWGLEGRLEYSTDLFEAVTVRRMAAHLDRLLRGIAESPEVRLSALPMLTRDDRGLLLEGWSGLSREYPLDVCIHRWIEEQMRRVPETVAVSFEGSRLTYAELAERSAAVAGRLRSWGVGPEVRVGLCAERSLELAVGLVGILRAGGAYVPLDPSYPPERLAFMVADARVAALVTQEHLLASLPMLEQTGAPLLLLDREDGAADLPDSSEIMSSDHPAYVIYTSGSTGWPKGVVIPHHALANHMFWLQETHGLSPSDRVLQKTPFSFDVSVWEFLWPLMMGAELVMARPGGHRDNEYVRDTVEQRGITVVYFIASMLGAFLETPGVEAACATLRHVFCGGEAMPSPVPDRFHQRLPRAGLHNIYGPTEVSIDSTWWTCEAGSARRVVPIGRPVSNTQFYVLDKNLELVPPGAVGELYIGGSGLGRGYLERAELTAERFVPNLFGEGMSGAGGAGSRLYRTGDLGRYLWDGALEFLGRVDEQVKVRGYRIELGEIEAVLGHAAGVQEVAVVAREAAGGDLRLVAYVVMSERVVTPHPRPLSHPLPPPGRGAPPPPQDPDFPLSRGVEGGWERGSGGEGLNGATFQTPSEAPEETADVDDLRAYAQERLPDYMVPSAFVAMEALPRTPSGKLDRKLLPAPSWGETADPSGKVALRTPAEEALGRIWREVLGVAQVGAEDDFFHLGGHSLLATQMTARVREVFGAELPLRQVFETPRLADLAARLPAPREGGALTGRAPAIPRRRGDRRPRLSFAQERLWFLHQMQPQSSVYNVPLSMRLRTAVSLPGLEWSLRELARRHEMLRTTFVMEGDRPAQQIAAEPAVPAVPVGWIDLAGWHPALREEQAQRLAAEEAQRPFDLARGPLLRALVIRLAPADHLLLLTLHHIVSDGWSTGILLRELGALYESFLLGRPASLTPLPVQYADFAEWQRDWLTGEVLEGLLDYWRDQLAGAPPVLKLPTDRPRPGVQTFRGALVPFRIPAAVAAAVRQVGKEQGATLFMTLLSAFGAFLRSHTRSSDLMIGSPVANRSRAELEGLIGFFVNTLALRIDLAGDPTFAELAGRVRETTLGAYAHQDLPFERLVEELQPERTLSYAPLIQVGFTSTEHHPAGDGTADGAGNAAGEDAAPPAGTGTAKFDLSLTLAQTPGGDLAGGFELNLDLFDLTTVQRMAGRFETLLARLAERPRDPLGALTAPGAAERHQMLCEWSTNLDGEPDEEPAAPFGHALFERQAARSPEAVALISRDLAVDRSMTYGELDAAANRLARSLRSRGVGPDVLVALFVERSFEMVIAILAVFKAGGAYVPLDPLHPRERIAFTLGDARVALILTQESLLAALPPQDTPVVCLDRDRKQIARRSSGARLPLTADPDNLAYIIYTSGSTGRPKGVMSTHRGLANSVIAQRQRLGLTPGERVLQFATCTFDASIYEIVLALSCGAPLCVADARDLLPGPDFVQLLRELGVTTLVLAPSALAVLPPVEPTLLRTLITAGEACPAALVAAWAPGRRFINAYGPTECSMWASMARCADGSRKPDIGRPIPRMLIYLVDEQLDPVPLGTVGEICLGGVGVSRGYLWRPALTAERFVPDPFAAEPGARLYHTGDLARFEPDGRIDYLRRLDAQVKWRGYRIELGEIEAVLSAHPAVGQCAVIVREDEPGDPRLVAYLKLHEGREGHEGEAAAPTAAELRAFLREKLPEYMLPSTFVLLAAMPTSPSGKTDRTALPAPSSSRLDAPDLGAPLTATERALCEIWASVLGLERVGADEDFFELGGHSLLATRVMSRVRETFRRDIPLRLLFDARTVAAMALEIGEPLAAAAAGMAPPITRRERQGDEAPVSFSQERLWFLDQLEAGSTAYNVPALLRLKTSLDAGALERSLSELMRRHEVLRTTFRAVAGSPVQVIAPEAKMSLAVLDLRGGPVWEREEAARRLAAAEAQRPFDLTAGPLFRASLLCLGEADFLLVLTLHHIVADGWSLGILLRELEAIYGAYQAGLPSPLPELPLQFADYAFWQREWLQGEELERHLAYWRERLSGAPPVLELPFDRPRPAVATQRGAGETLSLPREVAEGLRSLTQEKGATLFMVLLSAFAALLHRYTGSMDLVMGTPIANRTRSELEGLIGFFTNTLALRLDLAGDPAFPELLHRVREVTLGAFGHQDLPFEKLVEELHPQRSLSHNPLFQVMFVMQNAAPEAKAGEGAAEKPREVGRGVGVEIGTAKFDLLLAWAETPWGLEGRLEYSTDLFEAVTVRRMAAHLDRLLRGIAESPEARLSAIPMLTREDRGLLLEGWSGLSREYPLDVCIHRWIEEQMRRVPEAVAVSFEGSRLTYAELAERSAAVAGRLRSWGVGPEVRVGLCAERSLELAVGLVGILRAGGAYVPLDPSYPPERLAFMVADARVAALVTQEHLLASLPMLEQTGAPLLLLDREDGATELPNGPESMSSDHPAYVIYTSGSTGWPKGVVIPHHALANHMFWLQETHGLSPSDRVLQKTPFSFDVSVWEFLWPLMMGAELVMARPGGHRDNEYVRDTVEQRGITVVYFIASMLGAFLETPGVESACTTLRHVFCGGEAMPSPVPDRFHQRLPQAGLHNIYGPTEVSIDSTWWTCEAGSPRRVVPIGRPVSNTQFYVLDKNLELLVPPGAVGELYIGGSGLGRGYLERAELTAERFVPNLFGEGMSGAGGAGSRLYRTGDLGRYLWDGALEFLGRVDEQVKVRGYRIELGEIESVLGHAAGVQEVAVVAREAGGGGGGNLRLVAYVVMSERMARKPSRDGAVVTPHPRPLSHPLPPPGRGAPPPSQDLDFPLSREVGGGWERGSGGEGLNGAAFQTPSEAPEETADVDGLRAYAQERLPDYMVPSAFVAMEALPRTPNGKLDRKLLPVPSWGETADPSGKVALRTPAEEALGRIWREVLGVAWVGAEDDFFHLGGHSLLATQMTARVREVFGAELPLRQVFETPRLADLAAHLPAPREGGALTGRAPAIPRRRGDRRPRLSFAQERLWFLHQMQPQSSVYNVPLSMRLRTAVSLPGLEWSLRELARRHEVLRTTFVMEGDRPVQQIAAEPAVPVGWIDLAGWHPWSQISREEQAQRLAAEEAQRPFDLARGPLLRALVIRLAPADHLLHLTLHHIVSDGWSTGILLRELEALYESFLRGRPSVAAALPPLPVQYADFAEWQRDWLTGEVLEDLLGYWRDQLAGAPPVLELPTDHPRPAVQSFRGAVELVHLPTDVTERLRDLGRQEGATLFMTLLAAFQVLLARTSGQTDLVIGSPIANRTRSELEGLIGFFVNSLVLRTGLSLDSTFREHLRRVREVTLGAFAHQDLPFEMLVGELSPERNLSHNPLFQVMFVLQNAPTARQDAAENIPPDEAAGGPQPGDSGTSKFDLLLSLRETARGVEGVLEYNTDLFDQPTLRAMAVHLETLTAGLATHPGEPVAQPSLLTPEELQRLLVDWNQTAEDYPLDLCVHHLVERQADRTPEAVAVVSGDLEISYAALEERANRLAGFLRRHGVGPDSLVGICVERSHEMVIAALGILKAGGAYVPLDPSYPRERLSAILNDAQARVILTQRSLLPALPSHRAETLLLDEQAAEIGAMSPERPGGGATSRNLFYVLFTSGSTGRPKGCAIEHHSAVALLQWIRRWWADEDLQGVLASTSLNFDPSLFELFAPLTRGGAVIVAENALSLPDLPAAGRVTLISTVASALAELARMGAIPPSARVANLAGEPLLNAVVQRIYDGSGIERAYNLYGLTEDTLYTTGELVEPGSAELVTVGRPIANRQVYILSSDLSPVPVGVAGQIHIGGRGLARGYVRQPELTAELFLPHPFAAESGERLYRTGDLARHRRDGRIEFLGRLDHQVKVRGFRVELGEIEAALIRIPEVRDAVVLARDESGGKRLTAFLVPRPEATLATGALRAALREHLPEHMIPADFVALDALPLTPNGKVDRRALSASRAGGLDLGGELTPPRTPVERRLAELWCELLRVKEPGVEQSFFELGGHSLLATQLVSRIRNTFRVELPLRTIFEEPTIAEQALTILQHRAESEEGGGEILAQVEALSEEETFRRLREEIAWLPPLGTPTLGEALLE